MAEYIDREQVEEITWQEPYCHDPINVLTEVRERVRNIPTADVIPLEKIKELRSLALRVKHNTGSIDTLIDKLDKIIREC